VTVLFIPVMEIFDERVLRPSISKKRCEIKLACDPESNNTRQDLRELLLSYAKTTAVESMIMIG